MQLRTVPETKYLIMLTSTKRFRISHENVKGVNTSIRKHSTQCFKLGDEPDSAMRV
jgi:hypothetical protein